MQINFTGHQLEITDALKQFATEKMEKLQRHFDRILSIHVVFTVEKLRNVVEATMHVPGKDLHASAESDSMYTAIDLLIDKLDRQILKHKEMENAG